MQNIHKKDLLTDFLQKVPEHQSFGAFVNTFGHAWLNGHALDLCYNCSKNLFETRVYFVVQG